MKIKVKAYEKVTLKDALMNPEKLDLYFEDTSGDIIIKDFNKLLKITKIDEIISLIGNKIPNNKLSEALGSYKRMDEYLDITTISQIIKDYNQLKNTPLNRENIEKAIKLLQELLGD
jgi:hypothetical protein